MEVRVNFVRMFCMITALFLVSKVSAQNTYDKKELLVMMGNHMEVVKDEILPKIGKIPDLNTIKSLEDLQPFLKEGITLEFIEKEYVDYFSYMSEYNELNEITANEIVTQIINDTEDIQSLPECFHNWYFTQLGIEGGALACCVVAAVPIVGSAACIACVATAIGATIANEAAYQSCINGI